MNFLLKAFMFVIVACAHLPLQGFGHRMSEQTQSHVTAGAVIGTAAAIPTAVLSWYKNYLLNKIIAAEACFPYTLDQKSIEERHGIERYCQKLRDRIKWVKRAMIGCGIVSATALGYALVRVLGSQLLPQSGLSAEIILQGGDWVVPYAAVDFDTLVPAQPQHSSYGWERMGMREAWLAQAMPCVAVERFPTILNGLRTLENWIADQESAQLGSPSAAEGNSPMGRAKSSKLSEIEEALTHNAEMGNLVDIRNQQMYGVLLSKIAVLKRSLERVFPQRLMGD